MAGKKPNPDEVENHLKEELEKVIKSKNRVSKEKAGVTKKLEEKLREIKILQTAADKRDQQDEERKRCFKKLCKVFEDFKKTMDPEEDKGDEAAELPEPETPRRARRNAEQRRPAP